MKLINKFLIGFLALSIVATVSCTKGDDDGPTKDTTPKGSLSGTYYKDGTSAQVEWEAQSVTAVHDTSLFNEHVTITAKNAAGDVITILLGDTTLGYKSLFKNTFSESNYLEFGDDTAATTRMNDPSITSTSQILITDNGMADGILKGDIIILRWYKVYEGNDNDVLFASLSAGSFEAPLTRTSTPISGGDELTADINGVAFNPITTTSQGLTITAMDASAQTISVQLSSSSELGTHDISQVTGYSAMYFSGGTVYTSEGTITLTAFNASEETAEGSFVFTATPSGGGSPVEISNGTFSF